MTEGFQITKSYVARGERERGLSGVVAPRSKQTSAETGDLSPSSLPVYSNPPREFQRGGAFSGDEILSYGEGFGELGEPGATPGSDMPRLSGRACVACVRYVARGVNSQRVCLGYSRGTCPPQQSACVGAKRNRREEKH
jgi:hypothetical protein